MASSHNMDYDLEDFFTLSVDFNYTKGCDAVMYLSNGDPGYPAEPSEVEIERVCVGQIDITKEITSDGINALEEAAQEYIDDLDE